MADDVDVDVDVAAALTIAPERTSAARHSSLLVGLAFIVAAVAIIFAQHAAAFSAIRWGIASVVLSALVSCLVLFSSDRIRGEGLILPLSMVALWVFGYGLATLAWTRPRDLRNVVASGLRPESVPPALAIASVGLLAWITGFWLLRFRLLHLGLDAVRRWATRGARYPSMDYRMRRVVAVYCLGLIARFGQLVIGRFSFITTNLQGSLTQSSPIASVFGLVEQLAFVGLILASFAYFSRPSPGRRSFVVAVLVLEIGFGLLSGFRSVIVLKCLAVGLVYIVVRRKVPLAAFAAVVVGLAFLTPFTVAYRDEVRESNRTEVTAAEAVSLIPTLTRSTMRELTPNALSSAPVDFVTKRLRFIDEVAIIYQRTPSELPYIAPTETVGQAIGVMVPRIV